MKIKLKTFSIFGAVIFSLVLISAIFSPQKNFLVF